MPIRNPLQILYARWKHFIFHRQEFVVISYQKHKFTYLKLSCPNFVCSCLTDENKVI
jgi:hypothetical protein